MDGREREASPGLEALKAWARAQDPPALAAERRADGAQAVNIGRRQWEQIRSLLGIEPARRRTEGGRGTPLKPPPGTIPPA